MLVSVSDLFDGQLGKQRKVSMSPAARGSDGHDPYRQHGRDARYQSHPAAILQSRIAPEISPKMCRNMSK